MPDQSSTDAASGGGHRRRRPSSRRTASTLPDSDPRQPNFTPLTLDRTIIAIPLLDALKQESERRSAAEKKNRAAPPWEERKVVIDLNLDYPGGRAGARTRIYELLPLALEQAGLPHDHPVVHQTKSEETSQYIFARLTGPTIRALVALDAPAASPAPPAGLPTTPSGLVPTPQDPRDPTRVRALYRIWPDFKIEKLLTATVSTVKADAAHSAFAAWGSGLVWAVVDSGIDGDHPHFERYDNLKLDPPLVHLDFTGHDYVAADPSATPPAEPPAGPSRGTPLVDGFGHGTHVAGIIAGSIARDDPKPGAAGEFAPPRIVTRARDEHGDVHYRPVSCDRISGLAPRCKLVSLKVLDDEGQGDASNVIAAIERIQKINGYGRRLLIHGVNLSVGYDFEPEWFACGQSPLCVEVDRLVRSGVVVVVAAGNTGYGYLSTAFRSTVASGMPLTINDPGNAELAITVGSTHRDSPHLYGVSYFSSKGPTGDGRLKPDLVAPGERIISCAAGKGRKAAEDKLRQEIAAGTVPAPPHAGVAGVDSVSTAKSSPPGGNVEVPGGMHDCSCHYVEESGTSMAAPHVSGVIAAFLSVRREFIGRPQQVKELFVNSATDLRRDRYFQGAGLVDLMRAIQSV